jgi:tetratricopeptide (TPR) repeat protein
MDVRAVWNFDDPADSKSRFRALAEALTGEDREIALTQVARALGLQGRFAEGHAILDALNPGAPRALAYLGLERGRLFNSAGDRAGALPQFLRAAEEGVPLDLRIDALHMLAIADPDRALPWNLAALELARDSDLPEALRWIGSLLNNLGWTAHEAGDHEDALRYFREAVVERANQEDAAALHIARWCVARGLRSLGQRAEALEILRDLDPTDPYVREEIAAWS